MVPATERSGTALVVYSLPRPPRIASARDHLLAFERHSRLRCAYVNLFVRRVPRWLGALRPDLVVIHTSVLASMRWPADGAPWLVRRALRLRGLGGVVVALPQDDFLRSEPVGRLLAELGVDHVFTPVPASEWDEVYARLDRSHTRLHPALTGYLEDDEVARMERIAAEAGDDRPVDIGYRAWGGAPWVGRHGQLKQIVGDEFARHAPEHGLRVDISTREEDTLFGDDWTRFMARSKYTIGVEGGSSILDHDGSVKACTERHLAAHPDATFEEVEAACFPGRDGELDLRALSPRHLEACVTRTAQVLVEGDYNGVLEPGRHYIPLRRDLSNLGDVLEVIRRDDRRAEIVDAAHRDVVASGRWTYRGWIAEIEATALGDAPARAPSAARRALLALARVVDRFSWAAAVAQSRLMPLVRRLLQRGGRSR